MIMSVNLFNIAQSSVAKVDLEFQIGSEFLWELCSWLNRKSGSKFSPSGLVSVDHGSVTLNAISSMGEGPTSVLDGFLVGLNLTDQIVVISYGHGWEEFVSMGDPDCFNEVLRRFIAHGPYRDHDQYSQELYED